MASNDSTLPKDLTPLTSDELKELIEIAGGLVGRIQYVDKLAECLRIALDEKVRHYLNIFRIIKAYPDPRGADMLLFALANIEKTVEIEPNERHKILKYLPEIKAELRRLASDYCKAQGVTVSQLAKMIKMTDSKVLSESALHKILSDKNSAVPRESNLTKLLQVLGVDKLVIQIR